jgi:predicted  nucleic acid-binding Zn-ribbon protein
LRVYAEIDDLTLSEIDQEVIKRGITKKQLLAEAIDLYLHHDRSELDQAIKERDQARSEADQRWKEANQIKTEINQLKRDLEALRSREDQLRSDLEIARSEKDQASAEAIGLHRDLEHYKDTIRLKEDEIGFLRGHLSQLSEKITPALPPSQEEAKAKRWWRFWKR